MGCCKMHDVCYIVCMAKAAFCLSWFISCSVVYVKPQLISPVQLVAVPQLNIVEPYIYILIVHPSISRGSACGCTPLGVELTVVVQAGRDGAICVYRPLRPPVCRRAYVDLRRHCSRVCRTTPHSIH